MRSVLYAVAEEGREDYKCTDKEQTRTHKCQYRLGDAVLACVHLDINLETGHDDINSGYGATDVLDVQHHRHHVVVHRSQRVRTPTVVYATALGGNRVGEREAHRT